MTNRSIFRDKRILVTGVCGTVGKELVHQLLTKPEYNPKELIGLDNNESELFFQDQKYLDVVNAHFFVVDIRDRDELARKMNGVDIVFHCAAMKHVIMSERSPDQAIQTNIQGVQNIINASQLNGVEKVIFTSSDKAVNPTNVMGTSKLMGERLMTAANSSKRSNGTIFASTRFGNVLGSNGSVIPIFHNQIAKGGPVTLTDINMTRFVMSISDSVKLIIDSALLAKGGEVFITKMKVIRIEDLAKAMIAELAEKYNFKAEEIKVVEIGAKPGEKLYEELMSQEEMRRTVELKSYFSVLPAFRNIYHNIEYEYEDHINSVITKPYASNEEDPLSIGQIRIMLKKYGLLERMVTDNTSRYWPGDKEKLE